MKEKNNFWFDISFKVEYSILYSQTRGACWLFGGGYHTHTHIYIYIYTSLSTNWLTVFIDLSVSSSRRSANQRCLEQVWGKANYAQYQNLLQPLSWQHVPLVLRIPQLDNMIGTWISLGAFSLLNESSIRESMSFIGPVRRDFAISSLNMTPETEYTDDVGLRTRIDCSPLVHKHWEPWTNLWTRIKQFTHNYVLETYYLREIEMFLRGDEDLRKRKIVGSMRASIPLTLPARYFKNICIYPTPLHK